MNQHEQEIRQAALHEAAKVMCLTCEVGDWPICERGYFPPERWQCGQSHPCSAGLFHPCS